MIKPGLVLYGEFFGLKESPFNLTPDPGFLYLSHSHEDVLANIRYGIANRCGFMMVTGEVGTGKTTICRALLAQLGNDIDSSLIFNPSLNEIELFSAIVHDFGITRHSGEKGDLLEALNHFLLAGLTKGRNAVLIIDEAQNLPLESMEAIRMISNLETEKEKLIQIILVGQQELEGKLCHPSLRQIYQRIAIRVRIEKLSFAETRKYIDHRLRVASGDGIVASFSKSAVRTIHKYSKGCPRLINSLCDRALMAAYVKETHSITFSLARKAVRELLGPKVVRTISKKWIFIPSAVLLLFVFGTVLIMGSRNKEITPYGQEVTTISEAGREMIEAEASNEVFSSPDEADIPGMSQRSPDDSVAPDSPDSTPMASISILLRLYGLNHLAEEAAGWRAVNFGPDLLTVFFKQSDVVQQYNLGILTGLSLENSLKVDAPFMIPVQLEEEKLHYVVLSGMEENSFDIIDPLMGHKTLTREAFEDMVVGAPVFILPGQPVDRPLEDGDRGSAVMKLQEFLKTADYYHGRIDGIYGKKMVQAVKLLQSDFGIEENGIATAETWLLAGRINKAASIPRLKMEQ